MEELLKNIDVKKIAARAQKDPKMFELLKNLQGQSTATDKAISDPRARLHEKLKRCQVQRGNRKIQMTNSEKQKAKEEKKKQDEDKKKELEKEQIKEELMSTLSTVHKQQQKKHRAKLRKLSKKLGLITKEQYTQSIKIVNDALVSSDVMQYHANIIELYLQQGITEKEEILEIDDDTTNDIIDDIEKK